MNKFDKIFTFKYKGIPYFLFRSLNYGNESDELKYIFLANDKQFSRGVIGTKETLKLQIRDVITDYSEITYHNDGSVLLKYPGYPIESKRYDNPKEEGYRRNGLSEINNWEPLAIYSVFNYRVCEVSNEYMTEKAQKIYELENRHVFNGRPLRCLINLVNKNYSTPDFNNPNEVNIRIPGITKDLELWIIVKNIHEEGYFIDVEGFENPIFSNNSLVQIAEKKAQ